jgi:hypothetical protein
MHQATIRSLGFIEDKIMGKGLEAKSTNYKERRKEEFKCKTMRNKSSESSEEEGYKNRKFQTRGNQGIEKPRYSGPSAEDMLYGPYRIHYAYLDGKRVSNHEMKDCRTFLRLQSAMGSSQGGWQGEKNASQGYQVQRLTRHLESKVYISAMIQPMPKSKK